MFALLLMFSKTSLAIGEPTVVNTVGGLTLYPGVQYEFRAQSHADNSFIEFHFFIKSKLDLTPVISEYTAGTFVGKDEVYADKRSGHHSVYFTVPPCPSGSRFVWAIRNRRQLNGNLSNFVFQENPTIGLTVSAGQLSGVEVKCGTEAWDGIRPIVLRSVIDEPANAALIIHQGLTNWYHINDLDLIIEQTNAGLPFHPDLLTTSHVNKVYKFKAVESCIDNPKGIVGFVRLPSLTENTPPFNGFVVNPNQLSCSSYIDCKLKEVTYHELPNLLSLNGGIQSANITSIKWFYIDPNGQEIENGKLQNAGSYSYMGLPYQRKKVCYSDLLDANGTPQTNNYRGEITYTANYVDPVTEQSGSVSCNASIYSTVYPVNFPSELAEAGFTAFNAFQNTIALLEDAYPGLDVCSLLPLLEGFPVLGGIATGVEDDDVEVIEHCALPSEINEGYIASKDLESIGIDTTRVTYGWYKEVNRLANQDILISIQELGSGSYIRILEIDGLPVITIQELAVIDCIVPMLFPEIVHSIKEYKQEMASLGYDVIHVPNERQENNFKQEFMMIAVEKESVSSEDEISRAELFSMVVYPNPTQESFTIKLSGDAKESVNKISIKDASGRVVEHIYPTLQEKQNGLVVHSSTLTKGIYFIETYSSAGFSQQRLIIQ